MADTIEQIILDVQSLIPDADPNLARMWVRDAARRTLESRIWSFQLKRGTFSTRAAVTNISSGATVSLVQGDDVATFSSNIATDAMVGMQFRTTNTQQIFDIIGYVDVNKVRISPMWTYANSATAAFTIFDSRLVLPADCLEILSVISPVNRWMLWLGVPQEILDGNDPARSRGPANPSLLSPCDYSPLFSGSVAASTIVSGSGTKPYASGVYTGQANALFTVQVTTSGVGGTAQFKWKKNEGAFTTGVLSDSTNGNELQEGVSVLFPATSTFTLNDIFVIAATANVQPLLPRMEIYPYPTAASVFPYLYAARTPDLTDPGVPIPGMLAARGDIIREKALEFGAVYPGTEDRQNPYDQINRRDYHAANWMSLTLELGKKDNGLYQRNVLPGRQLPWAPWPFTASGNLQEYDPYWMYPDDMLF